MDSIQHSHSHKASYQSILTSDHRPLYSEGSEHLIRKPSQALSQPTLRISPPHRKQKTATDIFKAPLTKAKLTVFPNILKQTHENIRQFKKYDIKRLDDETTPNYIDLQSVKSPQPLKKYKPKKTKNTSVESISTNNPTPLNTLLQPSISQRTPAQSLIADPSTLKFHNLSSLNDSINHDRWKQDVKLTKLNKAYKMQQEFYKDKLAEIWKPDEIQKHLQQHIVSKGVNVKTGLRQIFILIHPQDLKVVQYYIPLYKLIDNPDEVDNDFNEWVSFLCHMLKLKKQRLFFFFLDGKPLTTLDEINTYEKVLYMNFVSEFDFWDHMRKLHKFINPYHQQKYHRLVLKLYDLKHKDEVIKFFHKKDNLYPYFISNEAKLKKKPQAPNQTLEATEDEEVDERMFDSSVFHLSPEQQNAYLSVIQTNIQKQKAKYSSTLQNLEDAMRQRLKKIKLLRRTSMKAPIQRDSLRPGEDEHYERLIIYGEMDSISDIKEYAMDKVSPSQMIIPKKKYSEIDIRNPMQFLTGEENQKFANIIKYVNVEKIMCEKQLSRRDVIIYLSIFKSLQDSDTMPTLTVGQTSGLYAQEQKSEIPQLVVSLKQLRRALPYLALYKPITNTKKLNEIFDKKYKCVAFMDFLDIFAQSSQQEFNENEDTFI